MSLAERKKKRLNTMEILKKLQEGKVITDGYKTKYKEYRDKLTPV